MNKKLVPVVIVLILLAAGGYYFKTKNGAAPGTQTAGQAINEASEFSNAMESGKPTACTLTKGTDVMEYLIKNKKMRMNTTTKVAEKTTVSHMINDLAYLYMWDDTTKQGTKMAVPTEEETKDMADKAKQYQASSAPEAKFDESDYKDFQDQGYTINCKSGNVNDSDFVPPADVKFIDPSEMMKQVTMPDGGQIDYKKLQEQYGVMQEPVEGGYEE